MPKLVNYICEDCGKEYNDEFFNDTEEVPEALESTCKEVVEKIKRDRTRALSTSSMETCGGRIIKGDNLKRNCQVWRWNDHGGK